MESRRQQLTSIGLLILRVGICVFMIHHGWGKFEFVRAGEFEKFPDPWGVLGNKWSLILAMSAEFICPMLIAVGFLTRLAVIPPIIAMGTAVALVHTNDPWFMSGPGPSKEPAMMFLVPFLTLLFTGAGKFSIDAMICPRRNPT
jgi:putative oxidoreductase